MISQGYNIICMGILLFGKYIKVPLATQGILATYFHTSLEFFVIVIICSNRG